MASFSDSPLEIIEEIIDALQDDVIALRACSLTCLSLLPLCRKYIFQSINLTLPSPRPPSKQNLQRVITSFAVLLDNNPRISDYVQNLVYHFHTCDFEDKHVPRVLNRLHRVQSFKLVGGSTNWNGLRQTFRDALLRLIHLRSLSRLEVSYLNDFPATAFFPCVNLAELTLIGVGGSAVESYEHNPSALEATPQLRSFTFSNSSCAYVLRLLNAPHSHNIPVLDFSKVRTLSVNVEEGSDLMITRALIAATEKLETLEYIVNDLTNGFAGFAESMNKSSFSTLRKLWFQFDINDQHQDPLCGLCEEISVLSGVNVIEEITLEAVVQTDCQCTTGSEWGRLDAVLTHGFPMLRHISLKIDIWVWRSFDDGIILRDKLNELPRKYFPLLSKNTTAMFNFSTSVNLV